MDFSLRPVYSVSMSMPTFIVPVSPDATGVLSNVAVAEADTVEIDVDTADEIEVTDISDEVEQMIEECV